MPKGKCPLLGISFSVGQMVNHRSVGQKLDKSSYLILFLWLSIDSWEELGSAVEEQSANV